MKRKKLLRDQGKPDRIDAAPTRRRLQRLLLTMSYTDVTDASGVSPVAVRKIANGEVSKVWRSTAERIASVRPLPAPRRALVPAVGAQRRLRALVAIGWPMTWLAARLDIKQGGNLWTLLTQPHIHASTHARIVDLYEDLWDAPPPAQTPRERAAVTLARRVASSRGWPPPMAWDEAEIDDPQGRPRGVHRRAS